MFQTSLLLACGFCRYRASVNTTVAYMLTPLTGLGVLFYVGVVITGASSYFIGEDTTPNPPCKAFSATSKAQHCLSFPPPLLSTVQDLPPPIFHEMIPWIARQT